MCFFAYAFAACLTHSPSSCAFTLAAKTDAVEAKRIIQLHCLQAGCDRPRQLTAQQQARLAAALGQVRSETAVVSGDVADTSALLAHGGACCL